MSGFTLPPSDRLAAALVARGMREVAIEVLLIAIGRSDRDATGCRAMLAALRSGKSWDEPVDVDLDLVLVQGLLDRARFFEARIVIKAAGLVSDPTGARLLVLLERALAPFPGEADPSFGAAIELVRAGAAAAAVRALDELIRQTPEPPEWLLDRHRTLESLVRGSWREASSVTRTTRDLVIAMLRARDLRGALEAAQRTGAHELAEVLARLIAATDLSHSDIRDEDDPETSPIEGHMYCAFQLRIGALETADAGYRLLLRKDPEDEKARARLTDVVELRRALGDEPEPIPPRPARPMDWLRKNAPRAAGGWSQGPTHARFGESLDDEATGTLDAAQEAELLLKLGNAEQALDVYRILAIRHPKQQVYLRRIVEIEALIAQRLAQAPLEEITVRTDLRALSARAVPTHPRIEIDQYATIQDEDDEPTQIDQLPRRKK